MRPAKNFSRLLALFILAVATVANGNVIYDRYYGQIGLLPPQYRINPLYRYLSPQLTPTSSLVQLRRSQNDTVPTVSLINAPIAPREEIPGLATFVSLAGIPGCGTLITQRHVLTAAHVASAFIDDPSSVRVFINTATIIFPDPNSEIRSVVNIYMHPGYGVAPSYVFLKNDIAVVRLNSPVRAVPRVHLSFDDLIAGDTAFTYGFGYPGYEGFPAQQQKLNSLKPSARQGLPSNELRKGTMVILSSSECYSAYQNYPGELLTDDQYVCVRTVNQPCEGDGGDPLVKNGLQFGVASANYYGCYFGFPAIYMRVGAFKDWISYWIDL